MPYRASAKDGETLLNMEFPTIVGTQTVAISLFKPSQESETEKEGGQEEEKPVTVISYEERATHIAEDITQNLAIHQQMIDEISEYANKKAVNIGLSTAFERGTDVSNPLNDYKQDMDTIKK